MPLHAGDKLGGYEIVAPIGAGGMGAVWKARDARLGRLVAIKVLKDDQGEIPRLVQEARAAAQLNHPNIVTIHEIGEQDGVVYIVMELIDGRPLQEHANPKGMPLRQALKFCIPIARALEAAHKSGVIHRDLKPQNVMVTAGGDVKLLDFGLAKLNPALESRGSADPTATLVEYPSTGKGQILGTVEYMSPEQAQGKAVDSRSDIFSFGTLFYEVLTGRRPFRGNDSISILAAILRDDPTPPSRASGIHLQPAAEQLVLRCLRKDPERRFQTAADLRVALEDLTEDAPQSRRLKWWWPAAAIAAVALVAGVMWWSPRAAKPREPQALRQITFDSGISAQAVFSPDGKLLAFASDRNDPGTLNIWLRQTAGGGLVQLTKDPGMEYNPQFSPDGTRLYYLTGDRSIYERPALGGPGRKVVDNAGPFVVSSKGEIAFIRTMITARPESMWIVTSEGGAPEPFHPECRLATRPAWSPNGEELFFVGRCGESLRGAVIVPRIGGAPRLAINMPLPASPATGMYATWFRLGAEGIIYPDWDRLYRFDLRGSPVPIGGGPSQFFPAASSAGDLIVTQVDHRTTAWSMGLDDRGQAGETAPSTVADAIGHFSVSHDGRMLVFGRLAGGAAGELVIRDLFTGGEKVIAEHQQLGVSFGSLWPQVAPDGSRVIYRVVGAQGGHYMLRTDTADVRKVTTMDKFQLGSDWSPDGKRVIGECPGPAAGICELDPDAATVKTLLVHPKDQLLYPSWSWDGSAIAFMRRKTPADTPIVIAAVTANGVAPEESWVEISPPRTENSRPRFGPAGTIVYYMLGRNGQRNLVAQSINKASHRPVGEPLKLQKTPTEITAITGANGPYPLITVTAKRLFYSAAADRGNLWMMRIE